jgi:hypothetical protein
MAFRRRPSLLGALLWTVLGLMFLLRNFGIGPDMWSVASRFWPVLLILLGLGKIIEYFLKKDAVAIRAGEIIGILLLLLIGSALSKVSEIHNVSRIMRELPFEVGGTPIRPGQWLGVSHTYSEDVTFPLESPLPIRIENSYGLVSITPGSDREIRVRLQKVVYGEEARTKGIASEIHILGSAENRSPSADVKPEADPGKKSDAKYFVVRTNRDELTSRDYEFKTDMEILVPKNSQVQVVNSYGEVRVSGIDGKLDLSATHRSLELRDCRGEFNITTRYAECRLANLKGSLNIDGRRGKIYVNNIQGNVKVSNEHLPLEISNVDGTLNITATEGNLLVEKVSKPVVIETRGTRVQVSNLQDSLKIKANYGNIDISDVASRIAIESRYATLSLKSIQGSVEIDSGSDNINADGVRGSFVLKARGSGVRANGIRGPLDIRTTLKDVVVNDFGNSCSITNEYAGISISSELGGGDVNVKNHNGDVDLFLPDSASFLMDATARNGKVESDYPGLEPTRNANIGSLKSRMKPGGPRITLETDSGDIHVYRAKGGKKGLIAEKAAFQWRIKRIAHPPLAVLSRSL